MAKAKSDPGVSMYYRNVGERLRWVREIASCSQDDVAQSLGMGQPAWNRYEKGHRKQEPHTMEAFCNRFRVSMEYIYRGRLTGVHRDLALKLAALHPELVLEPIGMD